MRRNTGKQAMMLLLSLAIFFTYGLAQERRSPDDIVQYTIQKPGEVLRGKEFSMGILLFVQPNWYVYAPTGNNAAQGMIETNVTFVLPKGFSRMGRIQFPDPEFKNGHEVYGGDSIAMNQLIKPAADLKRGKYEIKGRITWQCCNTDICLPPVTDEVIIPITVK
jgi:hypothetical protein